MRQVESTNVYDPYFEQHYVETLLWKFSDGVINWDKLTQVLLRMNFNPQRTVKISESGVTKFVLRIFFLQELMCALELVLKIMRDGQLDKAQRIIHWFSSNLSQPFFQDWLDAHGGWVCLL